MIFFEDRNVARSISARIVSYSVSLLDAGKSSSMACSILSPVGVLSYKPTPTPICREAPSTLRIHQLELSGSASCWGISVKKSYNIRPFNAK